VLSAEADPSEAEADQALTLLDSIEALSAELDSYNEGAMQAAEDVQVCYVTRYVTSVMTSWLFSFWVGGSECLLEE